MADLFKDLFSLELMNHISGSLQQVNCNFDKQLFLQQIFDSDWDEKEFKERMHHIADVVRTHLSDDFDDVVQELFLMIAYIKKTGGDNIKFAELAYIFIPDIIERNGIDFFDLSVDAFEKITPFTSCEFAVRPFIIKYQERMLARVHNWIMHPNEHVRRLASEGSRSRLPWGVAIQAFKDDPTPVLPIIEKLKNDPSEYVRRSVANNLNDISKDHPEQVIETAQRWIGDNKNTDWIVKHACRTLLKAGNPDVMHLFGYSSADMVELTDFRLDNDAVTIGNDLFFHFNLRNLSNSSELIRLEYAIYFLKKNGTLSKKVFKISEKRYEANSITEVTRKQSFKVVSTRKLYPGEHMVSVIINGKEIEERTFEING